MIYHAGVNICPSFKGVWAPTVLTHSPILNDGLTWSLDRNRHLIRTATLVHCDPIFSGPLRPVGCPFHQSDAFNWTLMVCRAS